MDVLRPAEIAAALLKCAPLVILALFGVAETARNNYTAVADGPCLTLLNVAHLVLLVASGGLVLVKCGLALECVENCEFLSTSLLRKVGEDFAMAVCLVLLPAIVCRRWWQCLPPSAFAAALLGLLSTGCVLDAFLQSTALTQQESITLSERNLRATSVLMSVLVAAAVIGSFLLSQLEDLVIKRPRPQEMIDEDTSSLVGRQIVTSFFPLFVDVIRKRPLAQLPMLRRGVRCKPLVLTLSSRLRESHIRPGRRQAFMTTFLRVLWVDFVRISLSTVGYYACIFARIPAMELLINSCSGVGMQAAILLFSATTVFELLITTYQLDILAVLACRVRTMLQGLVFQKVTAMSALTRARYPVGHIASLLSVDCWRVCVCSFPAPLPLFGALLLPVVFWMLAARAGVGPSLCCAAWTVLMLCLPLLSPLLQNWIWAKATRARDERLKATTDLLSAIRVVKMYAWEDALQERVLRYRDAEIKWLFRVNMLDAILDSVCSSTSSVLTIILFFTLPLLEPGIVLTPALSFSCVSLLYITDLTMSGCGQALRNMSQGSLALKRIADFCTAEEEHPRRNTSNALIHRKNGAVKMSKCSVTWPLPVDGKAEVQLVNISLDIEPGSLVGVVGFVGSGKSSLLAAILGDMHLIEGHVACTGRVAFVPQLPAVHNMTIRDNILYGRPMQPDFYSRVIQSCQLTNDINRLNSGDMTEVGEKGINLSGGQKQRISIARAVYSQSDVYLLDDPLSALDPVVAGRLFREVIGKKGLLRDQTRIMVCNQANYLRHMDKLALVHHKGIRVYDKLEDLINDPHSPQNFSRASHQQTTQRRGTQQTDTEGLGEIDEVGRITQDELGESKKTGCQLLGSLVRLAQWPALVAVLVFLGAAAASALQQLWIKWWTDASSAGSSAGFLPQHFDWVSVLVALSLTDVLLRVVGSVLLALSAKRLSRSLHNDMLSRVLWSPVSFFDQTPRGRIMNRFSADIDYPDARTFLSGKQCVQNTLITLAKVAVVGTQSPVVVGVTLIVAVFLGYGLNVSVKASHSCRYSESLGTSRLLQHTTETVDALSSVRTYGVADRFQRHFFRLSDAVMRGYAGYLSTYRFVRTLTAMAGFVVVMSTLLANTVFAPSGGPDPSSLALALSSACSVPLSLMLLCVMLFNVLQMIVSFERCVEYTELPPENDVPPTRCEGKPSTVSAFSSWPTQGEVEFLNYSASYRPGVLPNVLSDVTFRIRPMEKVGVVGRTGAGKSSLVLALLRMLRASQGRILIDGMDIAEVPLRKLRTSITVIPQDPSLVRGTLRMNLDPTDSHSDAEIWQALERSHLARVVSSDARGLLLETTDGGTNLSVGQRQLVCLARALLRGSKVLLLDEATSQMDGDTDRLIQATLRDAFAGSTLLTVAHRIHTVLDYDRILVLEEGRVREFDSVSALLSDTSSAFYGMAVEAGISSPRSNSNRITTAL
ncbi:ATP-binding cassette sub-family C member 3-like isoform X2 [Amblyomma americanum]